MIFSSLLSALECGKIVDIVTVIDSAFKRDIGKMLIIHGDGRVEGQLDESITKNIMDKIRIMPWTKPKSFFIEDQSGEKCRVMWDRISNGFNAIVFGGGHISQPLVQMLSMLDFVVTVVDDRPEFANQSRFPGAHKVICESFCQAFSKLSINHDTAVIIVTRGHKYDMECLRATMGSKAR